MLPPAFIHVYRSSDFSFSSSGNHTASFVAHASADSFPGALLPVPCAVPRVVLFSAGSSTRPAPWRAALLIQFKRCVHLSHVNIHALSPSQLPCRRKEKKSRKRSSCNPPRLAHMGTIQSSAQGVFFGHNIVRFLSEILFEQGAHSDQRICGAAKPKSMHPCSPRSSSLRFRFLPPTVATHGLSFQQNRSAKMKEKAL